MHTQAEQVQAIVNKFDKAVENVVIMDFTKSNIKVATEPQNIYQFPQEIGDLLLKVYKDSLYHASFDSIKRNLISDIREEKDMVSLNKMLFEFMEKREFIDNVNNNTLDMYKTENFVEPTAVAVLPDNNAIEEPAFAIPTGKDDPDYCRP